MHFVLAVPPARDVDAAARALAELLGGHALDRRQILLKGVPFIVQWTEALPEAQAMAVALQNAGLEAHAWHERALEAVPTPFEARAFRFDPDHLIVSDRRESVQIPLRDVVLVLRARTEHMVETSTETSQKKTNIAAMAMGLPISKTKVTQERQREQDQAWFLLIYTATTAVRLPQLGLDYTGLGARMQATATANYKCLQDMLGAACPDATFDARLERVAGRLATMPGEARRTTDRPDRKTIVRAATLALDNEDAVLRACRLLWLAERRRRATSG